MKHKRFTIRDQTEVALDLTTPLGEIPVGGFFKNGAGQVFMRVTTMHTGYVHYIHMHTGQSVRDGDDTTLVQALDAQLLVTNYGAEICQP